MKVLVVDDSADNRYFFESLLKGSGYDAAGAVNGAEALEKLTSDNFDLIISDILMPVMDGFRLLKECKGDPKLQDIPFIFITGVYLDQEDEELALKLGVKAFLRKPVEPGDLIKAIDAAVSGKPAPAKRGRKPKTKAIPDNTDKLLEDRLTAKLAKKMEELEAEAAERKQAEAALQESEEQYHLLFETMSQGVVYQDAGGRVLSANPAALKILGLTDDQIKGRTSYDPRWRSIHEDGTDYPGKEHPSMIALASGQVVRSARMGIYNPAEQRYRWVSIDAVPLTRPGEDRPYRVYTTFTDITESLFAHKAIMESESRLHAILENTIDAIFSIDRDFRLITANSAAKRRFEESSGHALIEGMDMLSVLPLERRAFWKDVTDRALKGERASFMMRYELASGAYDVEFSAYPIVSASGYITGFSFFGRDITERKKTEVSLKESEERFRIASQSTSDVVWDWDISSGHVEWAGKIDEMLGYGPGEFPRTLEAWEKALHPDDHDRVIEALDRHAQTGEPYNTEYRILQKNGAIRHWIDRGMVLRDAGGNIQRSVGVCIDITERRLSEQRSIIRRDLALKLTSSTDLEQALADCLEAAIKIASCDSGAIHMLDGKSGAFKLAVQSGFPAGFIRNFKTFERDSEVYRLIMKGAPAYITLDGVDSHLVELYTAEGINFVALIPIRFQNGVTGCMGISSHTAIGLGELERNSLVAIGAEIEGVLERIRSRRELEKSEERYRFIADHTDDVIWVVDRRLHYTYFSPSIFRQRGFTAEEMMAKDFTEVITPASVESMGKVLEAEMVPALQDEKPELRTFVTELEVYHKDGSKLWTETSMTLLLDQEGNFDGLFGISRDITARKKAEADLRASEEKYRSILDEMNEAYYEIDAKGNYTYFNDTLCRQLGYTREEMEGLNYKAYTPPEERRRTIEIFSGVFQTGTPARNVLLINTTKDGAVLYVENTIFPIRDASGAVTGLRGLGHDITERRKSEEELKKRALFLDAAYDSIIAFKESGDIVYSNETAAQSRGYTVEEMQSMNIRQFIPPENITLLEERLGVIGSLGELSFEVVHTARDGSLLDLEARVRSIVVEGTRLNIAVYRDITVRKKMQMEIVDSEARYRGIIETAGAAVLAVDLSGKLTYINDLGCETMGYSRDELLGRSFADLVHQDDRVKIIESFTEAINSPESFPEGLTIEFRSLHKDGSIIWFYTSPTIMTAGGKTIGFSAVMPNITKLKQAESALQENEQRYRSLFENNPVAVYMQDVYGRFISVNDATCRITGYSREEILALSPDKVIIPEDMERSRQHFIKALRGEPQTYEQTINGKMGNRIQLSVTNTAVKVNNKIVGVYSVSEDITERKKADADLKTALELINTTLEGTIEAIAVMSELRDPYTAGHQRMVTVLAVAIAGEIGLPEEQIRALRVAGLLHDVGKVYVPSEILSKPGRLSDLEMNLAKAHAEAGYDIVKTIKFPWPVAQIILQHHERMDGSGYPQGLKGEQIMLEARILAVADVVEAMMAHRPYRPALGVDKALDEISSHKGLLYHGPAVDACILLFREKGFSFAQ